MDYAHLQFSRGNIYRERLRGGQSTNLEYAVACYKEALQFYTLETFPREHRLAYIGLALAEGERQNWTEVYAACTYAHQASELLVQLASGETGRDAALKENFDSVQYEGFALTRLDRIAEAAVALEQGRTLGLAETLKLKTADPDHIHNLERRQRYILAQQQFIHAQAELHRSFSANIPRSEQRSLLLKRAEVYRKTKKTLDYILAEIRIAADPKNFTGDAFDSAALRKTVEFLGTGHALVYLVATPWGGIAVAAFAPNLLSPSAHFSVFDLPDMTDTFAHSFIQSELGPRTDQIISGFFHAQLGTGLSLLSDQEWLAAHEELQEDGTVLVPGWENETFRQRTLSLSSKCKASGQISTLCKAAQTLLNNAELASLVDRPLNHMKEDDKNVLANTLDHYFLSEELQVTLDKLSACVFSPLVVWLQKQGASSLTLIPCGWLAALPLPATPLEDGRTLGETIPTSVAPSARSLLQNQETQKVNRSGVYTIGDPRPTRQELPWGEAEALTIAKLTLLANGISGTIWPDSRKSDLTKGVNSKETGNEGELSTCFAICQQSQNWLGY
jgi:hypothetical protein